MKTRLNQKKINKNKKIKIKIKEIEWNLNGQILGRDNIIQNQSSSKPLKKKNKNKQRNTIKTSDKACHESWIE